MVPRQCIAAMGGVLIGACDPEIWTEHRQLSVESNLSVSYFLSGDPVLVGTQVCPTFDGVRVDDEVIRFEDAEAIATCYSTSLRGPASADGECFTVEAPGDVVWALDRVACHLDGNFGDDAVNFDVVAFDGVRGAFEQAVPMRPEYSDYFRIEAPAHDQRGVIAELGEPLLLLEGADSARTTIVTSEARRVVAVAEAELRSTIVRGLPTVEEPEAFTAIFEARAGDALAIAIETTEGVLDVGEVQIVARSEIHSLELFPEVMYVLAPEQFYGAGATAITRDRDGRVLREPPVTWRVVDGAFELDTFDFDEDGRDDPRPYATIRDACEGADADEQRHATLEGRIDAFRDTVEVRWTCPGTVEDGCACRSAPAVARPWLLFALLLLRTRRRTVSC